MHDSIRGVVSSHKITLFFSHAGRHPREAAGPLRLRLDTPRRVLDPHRRPLRRRLVSRKRLRDSRADGSANEISHFFQPSVRPLHKRDPEGPSGRVRREHDSGAAEARGVQHHQHRDPPEVQQLDAGPRHRPLEARAAREEEAGWP